jgi:diguanylate cyclase (GGDEF)-like protein/PAS domain S-box-containing protein
MTQDDVRPSRFLHLAVQRAALIQLSTLKLLDFPAHLSTALRIIAETLAVERVCYWSFNTDRTEMLCVGLHQRGSIDPLGLRLRCEAYPAYFAALVEGTIVTVTDAGTDPRVAELSETYTRPSRIGAYLDIPVFVRGELVGILCNEHVGGTREWREDEEHFAFSIGQHLALALEGAEHRATAERLRAAEACFRMLVERSPTPTWVGSMPDGVCLFANAAGAELSGVPLAEIEGLKAEPFYVNAADRADVLVTLRSEGKIRDKTLPFRRYNGEHYWGSLSIEPIEFAGTAANLVSVVDVTAQKMREVELERLAHQDVLTGLPNRMSLALTIEREIARRRRNPDACFAVCFIDLDNFKLVNDSQGHDAGDRVLVEVALRLNGATRKEDVVARLSGDEFAILLVGPVTDTQAHLLGSRIVQTLSEPYPHCNFALSASLGFVFCTDAHATADDLLRDADAAMYRAKRSGKNRIST